jgi:poly(A) polymerase
MVMHIEPSDYDIATSARPEEIVKIFPRTESIGAQFGVILVIYQGHAFEVATFRSDDAYVDGRRPTGVTFTDAKQDVLRRDFTINGLLYDPIEDRVIDYVDGRNDIDAKLVRAIGDPFARFQEDKLRVLRAVRFGARLGYRIEPATWDAVMQMAPSIHQVSSERIREELVRILTEGQSAVGIRMLHESGLSREILPEVEWNSHLERSLEMLNAGAQADFAMAVLLHQTAIHDVEGIIERLKFSRAEIHHVFALVQNLPKFYEVREMSLSQMKRFFRLFRFEDHLELARIHRVAAGEDLADYTYAMGTYKGWTPQDITPRPLISGEDLISLGFSPGPRFKEMLTRVEDEQLEGRIMDHAQAVDFIVQHYGEPKS